MNATSGPGGVYVTPATESELATERGVLGALLLTGQRLPTVLATGVKPDDFADDGHGLVYAAMLALHDRDATIDHVTVAAELEARGRLRVLGGTGGIANLAGFAADAPNLRQHALLIREQSQRRRVRELAQRLAQNPGDESARQALADAPTASLARFPLLTLQDLADFKPRDFLVDSMLPASAFVVLYGPSGVGKSFLALDWAACVGTGRPWYGRNTRAGRVVYIAAEGIAGLHVRIEAWRTARRHTDPITLEFIPEAVNFTDPADIARVRATVSENREPVALYVIDTVARSMVGKDENSAGDMGLLVAGVDELKRGSGAAALLVHHTGKAGDDERGSSALRGAADMMHKLAGDGATLRLECSKSKDWEPYDPWRLHLEPVAKSCVLALGTDPGRLAASELAILRAVSESFGTALASGTAIRDASDVPKSSFYRALNTLVERDYVRTETEGKTTRYGITPSGTAQLVPTSPNQSHGTAEPVPSHLSPIGTVGLGTNPGRDNGANRTRKEREALGERRETDSAEPSTSATAATG